MHSDKYIYVYISARYSFTIIFCSTHGMHAERKKESCYDVRYEQKKKERKKERKKDTLPLK